MSVRKIEKVPAGGGEVPTVPTSQSNMTVPRLALPLHIQRLERVLNVKPYLSVVEDTWTDRKGKGEEEEEMEEGEREAHLANPSVSKRYSSRWYRIYYIYTLSLFIFIMIIFAGYRKKSFLTLKMLRQKENG